MNDNKRVRLQNNCSSGESSEVDGSGGLKRAVIRGVAWITLASTTVRILAALSNLVLAKLLVPEVFGIIAIANVAIGGMELFSDFGVGRALIQYKGDTRTAAHTALTLRLLQGAVLFIIAAAFAGKFSEYYRTPELQLIIPILGINFLIFAAGAIPKSILSKDLKFKQQVIPQTLPALLQVITAITLAYYLRNVWSIIAGMVVMNLTKTVLFWRASPFRLRFRLDFAIARRLLSFGIPLFASGLVWFLVHNMGIVVIGRKWDMEQLGYFAFSFTIISLPVTEIVFILNTVMFPTYSRLSNSIRDLKNAYIITLRHTAYIMVPLCIGIPLFGGDLFRALYDTKWVEAIAPLQAFGVYAFMRALGASTGNVFLALGKTKHLLFNALICFVILVVFIYPVTVRYGITGVAWLFSLAWVITLSILLIWLKELIGVKFIDFFRVFKIPILASIIAMAPIKYLAGGIIPLSNLLTLIPAGVVIIMIYSAVVWLLDPTAALSIKRSIQEKKPVLL
ncbi:MAG: lipopolysaccharide biosynthesis protein [candidate division Zixibacteria bacterium]|nr:lipopolysaccharide biosynthesis protein [Candidatus Tariuqbacter arcticus]